VITRVTAEQFDEWCETLGPEAAVMRMIEHGYSEESAREMAGVWQAKQRNEEPPE